MRRALALLTLGMSFVVVGGLAQAQQIDVIETRQAGQDLLSGTFAGIRATVAAKGDLKTVELPARAMARWIKQFPSQFPKGSEKGHDTKALPAIWSDPAGFQKAANEMADASIKLADLAKAGNADAVASQVKVLGDTCSACHREYRAR